MARTVPSRQNTSDRPRCSDVCLGHHPEVTTLIAASFARGNGPNATPAGKTSYKSICDGGGGDGGVVMMVAMVVWVVILTLCMERGTVRMIL